MKKYIKTSDEMFKVEELQHIKKDMQFLTTGTCFYRVVLNHKIKIPFKTYELMEEGYELIIDFLLNSKERTLNI